MKAILRLFILVSLSTLVFGESVTGPTPLRIEPASDAPVLLTLMPGDRLTTVDDADLPVGMAPLPAGWVAVARQAEYQGYVNNSEVMKDFTVEVGAGILLEASMEAPLLTVVEEGDLTRVADVVGDWSRVIIDKSLIGFIEAADLAKSAAPIAGTAPVAMAESAPPPPLVNPTPNADFAPVTMNGRLERTRRVFGRGPEQEFQLISPQGKVIAYLETDSLIQTEPVDRFLGLNVNVLGIPRKPEDSRIVILQVENLRLATP